MRLSAVLGLILFSVICTVTVVEVYQRATACPQVTESTKPDLPAGPRLPTSGGQRF